MLRIICNITLCLVLSVFTASVIVAESSGDVVSVVEMNAGILPGTEKLLEYAIDRSVKDSSKLLVIILDTPGGLLHTTQGMIKKIFNSPVPIAVYISPTGASAMSAGVFVTMSAHIAAMAPGTSIGAAHPVLPTGENVSNSDMRAKVENITVAMAKAISEERGRNGAWAEKAVRESASLTEKEAQKEGVIDFVATDIQDLLKKASGRRVNVKGKGEIVLPQLSSARIIKYEVPFKIKVINTLANPQVSQILWVIATTGLTIEFYNPGAILPGVVGAICLILALVSYQIIPINVTGIVFMFLGAVLIGAEIFVPSGILGIAGIVCFALGSIYLIDPTTIIGIHVDHTFVLSVSVIAGILLLLVSYAVLKAHRRRSVTGEEGLVGLKGRAITDIDGTGKVFVDGEYWNAISKKGKIYRGSQIEVVGIREGMELEVRPIERDSKES